jgi:hypothetical protein
MMEASTTPHRATMKKQPLDHFHNTAWPIRLAIFLIDRLTSPWLVAAAAPILLKALQ